MYLLACKGGTFLISGLLAWSWWLGIKCLRLAIVSRVHIIADLQFIQGAELDHVENDVYLLHWCSAKGSKRCFIHSLAVVKIHITVMDRLHIDNSHGSRSTNKCWEFITLLRWRMGKY